MRFPGFSCLVLACLLSVPLSLHAQVPQGPPGGGYGGGGYGGRMGRGMGRHGGMMGGPPGGRMELPGQDEVDGPPTPVALRDLVGLDATGSARFTAIYTPQMDCTTSERDSLRAAMKTLRDARDNGDRDAMRAAFREHGSDIRRLWQDLSKRDEAFDKEATKSLTKDQRKKLEQWQDEQAKARDEERRAPIRSSRNAELLGSAPSVTSLTHQQ